MGPNFSKPHPYAGLQPYEQLLPADDAECWGQGAQALRTPSVGWMLSMPQTSGVSHSAGAESSAWRKAVTAVIGNATDMPGTTDGAAVPDL